MPNNPACWLVCWALMMVLAPVRCADAQALPSFASNVVVPQTRSFALHPAGAVQVTEVEAGVVILEQVATTTLDVSLRNPTNRRLEAEVLLPVPSESVVRGFTFQGQAAEPAAQLLPKDEAKQIYNALVAKVRDPALLEFSGYNLIRTSVFPVEAGGTQKVRVTYEHLLTADGDRIDYVLPRSESTTYSVPWKVAVTIHSKRPISTVYSPSHKLETTRSAAGAVSARIATDAATEPGAFRLSYLFEKDGVTATLFAYPVAKAEGGYFLMVAGLPHSPHAGDGAGIKREVTLVLDRSGSMNGEKIEQVREAALQIVAGLEHDESINIITYNEAVDLLATKPLPTNDENRQSARKYIQSISARGGTNIHDALLETLRQKPSRDVLPIVLFLTDGLPTVGQTSELAIRNVALQANPYQRRIFTFGVGVDVNTPLLEKLASATRGKSTFVLPNEDVEAKIGQVFKDLEGPVLADAKFDVVGTDGNSARGRVTDVLPAELPDLYQGDQLVLLGRYREDTPLTFVVSGNYLGQRKSFRFQFDLDNATTRNAFVSRLWASRKIADLVDAIRQSGANGDVNFLAKGNISADPKLKELTDEILRLTTEFGILTEYTAFLAREGTDLTKKDDVLNRAVDNFDRRAVKSRSGLESVNQSLNLQSQQSAFYLNARNAFYDSGMNRVAITSVQQINDRAYFQRNGRWIDGRIVQQSGNLQPRTTIEFGSDEFQRLLERLTTEGRQGSVSLGGDILLLVDNEPVLVKGPSADQSTKTAK